MNKKQKEIIEKVNKVLESIIGSSLVLEKEGKREVPTYNGETCIYDNIEFSLEWNSELGEVICDNIVLSKNFNMRDVWKVFDKIYMDFNVDDHVEPLLEMRGTNGIPTSIRMLVEDAEVIEQTYKDISEKLHDLVKEK